MSRRIVTQRPPNAGPEKVEKYSAAGSVLAFSELLHVKRAAADAIAAGHAPQAELAKVLAELNEVARTHPDAAVVFLGIGLPTTGVGTPIGPSPLELRGNSRSTGETGTGWDKE